nr:MAG TPA: hypothetical protein [Caudoviricetes sp.]
MANIIMHDGLQNIIREMQVNDFKEAKYEIKMLEGWIMEVLRTGCIHVDSDPRETLKFVDHLVYLTEIFKGFIPSEELEKDDER